MIELLRPNQNKKKTDMNNNQNLQNFLVNWENPLGRLIMFDMIYNI